MGICQQNRETDLYFLDKNRIVFMPQGWSDEMRDSDGIICWYGNPSVLDYKGRLPQEWLTTDGQAYFPIPYLEKLPQVTEAEARNLDPDLFELLDYVNQG